MVNLVPILGIVFGCGIALLAIWTEYSRDKTLIEKGLYQPKQPDPPGPPGLGFLAVGSVVAGIGVALLVSTVIFQMGKQTGMPGLVFLCIGIALLAVHFLARQRRISPGD